MADCYFIYFVSHHIPRLICVAALHCCPRGNILLMSWSRMIMELLKQYLVSRQDSNNWYY